MKVRIAIPADKRAVLKRAGGARLRLAYRLADGKKYAETLRAEL